MTESPARRAARVRQSERAKTRQQEVEEEVLWMDECGLHPEWWPAKVGVPTLSALEKRMRSHPRIRAKIHAAMDFARDKHVVQ